jgi:ubiquinone/menaquinone biosynthesis C-methylase UbiE
MEKVKYHPEEYWSEVGKRIEIRDGGKNVIAGDDEPYYRYKRKRFLDLLHSIDFNNKSVLEVGCGPGGNLLEVLKNNPSNLVGVDISDQMVLLAKNKVPEQVKVYKTNGTKLEFADKSFDIVFTATVLQHNTDEKMLMQLMKEICRVSSDRVFIFERIENEIKGDDLCLGRPVSYYSNIMNENGFKLISKEHINIRISYYISGAIRKLLNPSTRKEGEPLNKTSIFLQNLTLPLTKVLDKVFTSEKDIAKLEFKREN